MKWLNNYLDKLIDRTQKKVDKMEAEEEAEQKADKIVYERKIDESKKNLLNSEINDIGMYHFKRYEVIKRDYSVDDKVRAFHYLLAIVFQGRIEEFKDIEKQIKEENCVFENKVNKAFIDWFKNNKPKLIKALKIAEKYENQDIGYDYKVGETIGEYTNRKIRKNKTFMGIYLYYSNLNSKELFLNIKKNN